MLSGGLRGSCRPANMEYAELIVLAPVLVWEKKFLLRVFTFTSFSRD